MKHIQTVSQVSQQGAGAANEAQKVGSFYDRMVEPGPISFGLTAGTTVAAYCFGNPILAAISIGAGVILICKRLFARSTTVEDPLTLKLEKMKFSDAKEERLEEFIKDFDGVSGEKQKAADNGNNKQTTDLSKLHQSRDNPSIESEKIKQWINRIKKELPLPIDEELALNFKNMESGNADTRFTALSGLVKAYETASDHQVAIIKAIIKMFNDETNGLKAYNEIEWFILNGKINNAAKLQTMVDGFADYLKNPGEIEWENPSYNDTISVLFRLLGKLSIMVEKSWLPGITEIEEQKIDLIQFNQSLEDLMKNVPNTRYSSLMKEKIQSMQKNLK